MREGWVLIPSEQGKYSNRREAQKWAVERAEFGLNPFGTGKVFKQKYLNYI